MKQVIIIGAGRSGTKFLRGILAASDSVRAVPYDVNYIWREGNESHPDDELPAESVTLKLSARIRKALYAQAGVGPENETRILVEKSVPNSLRVPFVNAVFPDALFVHLVRDGRQVVESAHRNWKQGPEPAYLLHKIRSFPLRNWRYGVWYAANTVKRMLGKKAGASRATWGPRYRGIDVDIAQLPLIQVVARQWARCVEHSRSALAEIPEARCFEIRYDELVADQDVVERLARFVGIPDVERVVEKFRNSLAPPAVDGWRQRLTEEERQLAMLEIGDALKALGYE